MGFLRTKRQLNRSIQRTGASRFAQRQIQRQGRLAPVAELGVVGVTSMRKLIAVSFLGALVVLGCPLACAPRPAEPAITLTALGRATNADGSIQFLVAITNNTIFPVDCCVGPQRVTTQVVGSVSYPTTIRLTNYMGLFRKNGQ